MADAVQVQHELDSLQKFALLLEIDRTPEYLAEIETQFTQVYGSRLVEAIGRDKYDAIFQISDQLDRVLSLLEQVRLAIIADENVDWRGAVEENVRLLGEQRKQQLEARIAEDKHTSLAQSRAELIRSLTLPLLHTDPDIVEFMADVIILDSTSRSAEETLTEAAQRIELVRQTTDPDISIDPWAVAVALKPAATALAATNPGFAQTLADTTTIIEESATVDISSPAIPFAAAVTTIAAFAGFSETTVATLPQQTHQIAALALQTLKPAQAEQVTQVLTQPNLQLTQLFHRLKQEATLQAQINAAADKHVKLSGLPPDQQKEVAMVIKQHVMPPLVYAWSMAKTAEDKQILSQAQKVFAMLGLDEYKKHGHVVASATSTAFYQTLYSFDFEAVYSSIISTPNVQTYYLSKRGAASGFFQQMYSMGASHLQDKASNLIAEKFMASSLGQTIKSALGFTAKTAVTEAAAVGAGEGAAVAAGAAAGGPAAWAIFAAAIIATKAKDAVSWLQRNFKEYILPAIGFLGGLFLAGPAGALVGGAAGYGITRVGLGGIGSGASRFFNGITALAATEIFTPIIVIALVIPPILALFMFIINNSAYIVPQATGIISGGVNPEIGGSCPIPNGYILCGSLGSPYQDGCIGGHGSNEYWGGQGGAACRWGLPSSDGVRCTTNPFPNSVCYNRSSTCTDYGYASDFTYPNKTNAQRCNSPVYLPSLNNQQLDWTLQWGRANLGGVGWSGFLLATDGSNVYEIYMTHLNAVPAGGKSGRVTGTLYCSVATPHVHLELRVNGKYVRPDFLCENSVNPIP